MLIWGKDRLALKSLESRNILYSALYILHLFFSSPKEKKSSKKGKRKASDNVSRALISALSKEKY